MRHLPLLCVTCHFALPTRVLFNIGMEFALIIIIQSTCPKIGEERNSECGEPLHLVIRILCTTVAWRSSQIWQVPARPLYHVVQLNAMMCGRELIAELCSGIFTVATQMEVINLSVIWSLKPPKVRARFTSACTY